MEENNNNDKINEPSENDEIGNKLEDFVILSILNKGKNGFVAKVKSKKNNKIYAMKKYNLSINEEQKQLFLNEKIFLKKLNHENICKYYLSFIESNCLYFIMEYMDNGSLLDLINTYLELNKTIKKKIEDKTLFNIILQCLRGVAYIHSLGLIHLDIKPAHFLMDSYGHVKLIDFKIACLLDEKNINFFIDDKDKDKFKNLVIKNKLPSIVGGFKPPQNNNKNDNDIINYYEKIDVYSLGVTFCSLIFLDTSFHEKECNELFNEIKRMLYEIPKYRPTSKDIYKIIKNNYIKYEKINSGLKSSFMCLLSFPILSGYLSTFEDNKFIDKKGILFQCVECNKFLKALSSGNENEKNNKNNELNSFLYDLSEKLYEKGLINHLRCKKDIEPIYIINFLLKEINNEIKKLNKQNINNNNNIQNEIYEKRNNKENSFEMYYKWYDNFKTYLSENFFGTFKTKIFCLEKKLQEYSYNKFYSICFDVKGILGENHDKNKITIYDAFNYFNKKYIKLDLNKYNLIDDCKESNSHYEYKQFYSIPNHLIIFLDRGQKCQYKKMIDFDERLILKKEHVESYKHNTEVIYDLCSVISRIEEMNKNTKRREIKYIYYKKNKKGKYQKEEEKEKEYDLKEVKYTGDIINLFYLYKGNQNISPDNKINKNHQKIENYQANISGKIESSVNKNINQNNKIDNDNNQINVNVNNKSNINQKINQNNEIDNNYQNRQTENNQDNKSVDTDYILDEYFES